MLIQRTFIPGSECIYFKIYIGKKMADEFLIKIITPLVHIFIKKNYIKRWFFIRFEDPEFHIRLRLFINTNITTAGEIINICYPYFFKWAKNNFMYKIQLDTYIRELERYGKNLIEESEYLFYRNSECIISVLKLFSKDENLRWMFSIKLFDNITNDFNLDLVKKQYLTEQLCISYKSEFGFNSQNSKQFNVMFRSHRKQIESIIQNNSSEFAKNSLFHKALSLYSKETLEINQKITNKRKPKISKNEVYHFLASHIHMAMNRLFMDKARIHELIIYDMLNHYYTCELAKIKYKKTIKRI